MPPVPEVALFAVIPAGKVVDQANVGETCVALVGV